MDEIVYSAASPLRSPGCFARDALADARVAPVAGWRIFLRGLQSRHRDRRLRYAWVVVPPVVSTLVWVFLSRSGAVRFGDTGIAYAAYVGTGTVLWQLFLDALNAPLRQLSGAREVLKKARLPHESWIVAGALEATFHFAIRLAIVAVLCVVLGIAPRAALTLVPLGAAALLLTGLAIGLLLTPAGMLYGDIEQGLTVATGVWFFATPIVYPRPDGGTLAMLVDLNPVTPLVVATRAWLTGAPGAQPWQFAAVTAGALCAAGTAWLVYRVAQPHLVARL